jgi:hypothetical protein
MVSKALQQSWLMNKLTKFQDSKFFIFLNLQFLKDPIIFIIYLFFWFEYDQKCLEWFLCSLILKESCILLIHGTFGWWNTMGSKGYSTKNQANVIIGLIDTGDKSYSYSNMMLFDNFYVNHPLLHPQVQLALFLINFMKTFISRFSQAFTHFICLFSSRNCIFISLLLWMTVKGKYDVLYDINMVIKFLLKILKKLIWLNKPSAKRVKLNW